MHGCTERSEQVKIIIADFSRNRYNKERAQCQTASPKVEEASKAFPLVIMFNLLLPMSSSRNK